VTKLSRRNFTGQVGSVIAVAMSALCISVTAGSSGSHSALSLPAIPVVAAAGTASSLPDGSAPPADSTPWG
jgi:hypothetical protein